MPSQVPYLQRRGHSLAFRISVPPDLRLRMGMREITKALPTLDRKIATPMALSLAGQAKLLFIRLREMTKNKKTLDEDTIDVSYTFEVELDQFGSPKRFKIQAEPHEKDAVNSAIRSAIEASTKARFISPPFETDTVPQSTQPPVIKTPTAPLLSAIVENFLSKFERSKKEAMFKKHKSVLAMLLEVVGDKPICDIKQGDLNNFFDLLGQLPPRWKDQCRKNNLSIYELSQLDHEITIGPKTFEDTYIASIRPFLKVSRRNFQDEGFPLGLTTEGTEYSGDREEGENKQRAFRLTELKRLFEGKEMQTFANDHKQAHCFWLPHLGLFTGARVNEICQLNPHTDIVSDLDTGTWYLRITTETESDSRVRKSVKSGDSRTVPIHKSLIELGFLKYVDAVKATGAKLLFPEWQPINRRASGEAEKWFRELLRATELRDETPKACILGMHAFRHTILTYGAMQKPPLSLFCISGHAQAEAPIEATGAGKGYLTLSLLSPVSQRETLLNELDYGLCFFRPVQQ